MGKDAKIPDANAADNSNFRCGTVALAGRSNVGKSTLLNRLIGAKVAIETEKPQATRSRILGIRTLPGAQLLWVDLPGIHRARSPLNVRMVETARRAIVDADVVAVVLDAGRGFVREDEDVTTLVSGLARPWLVAVNKIDLVGPAELLALTARLGDRFPGRDVVPVSARSGENLPELERAVAAVLPVCPALYPEDELTDQSARALVQEFVREKIFEVTGAELPYQSAVLVDTFVEKPEKNLNVVQATVFVERESQKKILIGKRGATIGEIGRRARVQLESFFGRRFFLELFVKVKPDWSKSPRTLDELGV